MSIRKSSIQEAILQAKEIESSALAKAKKALEFLEGGDKVKLSLLMKGRQMAMKKW